MCVGHILVVFSFQGHCNVTGHSAYLINATSMVVYLHDFSVSRYEIYTTRTTHVLFTVFGGMYMVRDQTIIREETYCRHFMVRDHNITVNKMC